MKKILTLFVVVMIFGVMLIGCTSQPSQEKEGNADAVPEDEEISESIDSIEDLEEIDSGTEIDTLESDLENW